MSLLADATIAVSKIAVDPAPARDTVLVVGAGLTGIEAATEMEG